MMMKYTTPIPPISQPELCTTSSPENVSGEVHLKGQEQTEELLVQEQAAELSVHEQTDDLIRQKQTAYLIGPKQTEDLIRQEQTEDLLRPKQTEDLIRPKQTADRIRLKQTEDLIRQEQTEDLIRPKQTQDRIRPKQTEDLIRQKQTEDRIRHEQTAALIRQKQTEGLIRPKQTEDLIRQKQTERLISQKQTENCIRQKQTEDLIRQEQTEDRKREEQSEKLIRRNRKQTEDLTRQKQTERYIRHEQIEDRTDTDIVRMTVKGFTESPARPSSQPITSFTVDMGSGKRGEKLPASAGHRQKRDRVKKQRQIPGFVDYSYEEDQLMAEIVREARLTEVRERNRQVNIKLYDAHRRRLVVEFRNLQLQKQASERKIADPSERRKLVKEMAEGMRKSAKEDQICTNGRTSRVGIYEMNSQASGNFTDASIPALSDHSNCEESAIL